MLKPSGAVAAGEVAVVDTILSLEARTDSGEGRALLKLDFEGVPASLIHFQLNSSPNFRYNRCMQYGDCIYDYANGRYVGHRELARLNSQANGGWG